MIDQINELPEDGLKSSPKMLRYKENKWISQKNQNKLYFLQLIYILNGLPLIRQHFIIGYITVYIVDPINVSQLMLSDQQFSLENPRYVFK